MKNRIECPFCDGFAILNSGSSELIYKGVPTVVKTLYYKCEECLEEFTTTESDTQTLLQIYNDDTEGMIKEQTKQEEK